MRYRYIWSALLLVPLFAVAARGQAAAPDRAGVVVLPALDQAAVALNGPWKFHTGDNPQWAQPNFDDSNWQNYTIDTKRPTLKVAQAIQSDQMPGWQQHGHPGYTGYAWYRIRLQVPPDASSLALLMPQYVDDAYEVYVNGQKIGSFGKLDRWHVLYPQQPMIFSISAAPLHIGQPAILAIRDWNQRYDAVPSKHDLDGGLRGVPLLGSSDLLHIFQQSVRAQIGKTLWPGWLMAALYGAVGGISLFLFMFGRSQREYLWAGISLTTLAALVVFETIAVTPETNISLQALSALTVISEWIGYFALSLAAMYLLGVPRLLWRRVNYAVMVGLLGDLLLSLGLHLGLLPPTSVMDRVHSVSFPVSLLALVLLLLAIAVDGLRTLGRTAWLLLTPGLLTACGLICQLGDPSPSTSFAYYDFFYLSVPLAVLLIFLLRFTQQQRESARLVDDMKQAQEVQQVLLPEDLPQIPGLTIESIYRPAREVGGDFFQILPHPIDGSALVVVGDVTGKGLQAGMLVSLIVGAVRTEAAHTSDPLAMLLMLNERLCGRGHAHATGLALRIEADGTVTLANAGHLPPYVNGEEVEMEGALPLGMVQNAEFPVMTFQLEPGDTLMLMSDGIAEAQDKKGELFGFDRIRALLQKPITAAEVATTAQRFGQQDDISVMTVQRNPQAVIAVA